MARSATVFACSSCGHESPKWHGRCQGCGEWNTLVEESRAARAAVGGRRRKEGRALKPVPLADVQAARIERLRDGHRRTRPCAGRRRRSGLARAHRRLARASASRRSRALRSAALPRLAAMSSTSRARSRPPRSSCAPSASARRPPGADRAETDLDAVLATIDAERPDVCVVDSVQVLYDPAMSGARARSGRCARWRAG